METTTKRLMMAGQSYNKVIVQNDQLFVPVASNSSTKTYIHLIDPSTAQNLLSIELPQKFTFTHTFNYQRYNLKLFVFPESNVTSFYIVDLMSGNLKISSVNYLGSTGKWSRISETQCIRVVPYVSAYEIIDLDTEVVTEYSPYTAATTPGLGGDNNEGVVTFYNKSDTGLQLFDADVYWTSNFSTSSSFTGEISRSTISGATLSARTVVISNDTNHSRNSGINFNSDYGALVRFDNSVYDIDRAGESVGLRAGGLNITVASNTYTTRSVSTSAWCGLSDRSIWRPYRNVGFGEAYYAVHNSAGSVIHNELLAVEFDTVNQDIYSSSLIRLNEADEVAAVWQSPSVSNSTYKIQRMDANSYIVSGPTLVTGIDPATSTDPAYLFTSSQSELGHVYADSSFTP